jgi:PAS domain S-box-containing protein
LSLSDATLDRSLPDSPEETDNRYRQLFDHLIHGFAIQEIICDEQGKPCDFRILEVNKRWEEITGARAEDVIGKTAREMFPEVEDYWIEALGRVALTGEPARLENYARALGKYLDLSVYSPRKGQFASVCIDVTQEKRTLDALRKSEARFRATFDRAGIGIALVDLSGRILDCNPSLERMMGFTREELMARTFAEITHPEDRQRNLEVHEEVVAGRRDHYALEKRYVRKDGSTIWGRLNVSLVRDAEGKPDYSIGMVEDVTERKRAEEELRRVNADLEQRVRERTAALDSANKELSAFSYSVSHDLRAPLRHVTGFVNLLEQHAGASMDDKSRRYAGIIADSARRMGRLIDDLLEFSRTGRAELKKTVFELMPLIEEVRKECLRDASGRNVRWRLSALPEIAGDRSLLRLVFVNLISNALKFTRDRDPAEIEIGASPAENEVVICVRDNGVGFDPVYSAKLFGIFQRLHAAEEFEGTGIGLANVKRIVERHGGRVWAQGEVGRGAAFFVSLPRSADAELEGRA